MGAAGGTRENQVAGNQQRAAPIRRGGANQIAIVRGRVTWGRKGGHFERTARVRLPLPQSAPARRLRAQGNERRLDVEPLHDFAKPSRMFRFDVSQENSIELLNPRRPYRLESLNARARVKQDGPRRTALTHEVGVGHANTVGHPERPDTERQRANVRHRILPTTERAQTDFVELKHPGNPAQFVTTEVRSIIDRVEDFAQRHPGALGHEFVRKPGPAHSFFQHIAEFVFER